LTASCPGAVGYLNICFTINKRSSKTSPVTQVQGVSFQRTEKGTKVYEYFVVTYREYSDDYNTGPTISKGKTERFSVATLGYEGAKKEAIKFRTEKVEEAYKKERELRRKLELRKDS